MKALDVKTDKKQGNKNKKKTSFVVKNKLRPKIILKPS